MTDDALRSLLAKRAVVRGRITLSSGVVSEYYFDCKRVGGARRVELQRDALLVATAD
jgi:orotate phosphoribosyltransferase